MNQPPGNFGAKRGHRGLKLGLWDRGFQRGVQEKVKRGLFRTVNDYGSQNIMWSDSVEQDVRFLRRFHRRSFSVAPMRRGALRFTSLSGFPSLNRPSHDA